LALSENPTARAFIRYSSNSQQIMSIGRTSAKALDIAKALFRFLTSPTVAPMLNTTGVEPY
jgi:hypothetical protein